MDSTSSSAAEQATSDASAATAKGMPKWFLLCCALCAIAISWADWTAQHQPVSGDPLRVVEPQGQEWWRAPRETNRFNRQVGVGLDQELAAIVFDADGQRGWAVGGGGTILTTRDAGETWQSQVSKTKSNLNSIIFLADGQHGWAVGESGTILATRDAGVTWHAQSPETNKRLFSVLFLPDGQRGWVVGEFGTILTTRDAGVTWQAQERKTRNWIRSVTFLTDGQRGWAVGDEDTILSTRDAGATWQAQKSDTDANLASVTFLADGQRGWAVGDGGTILATLDAGATWQAQASNTKVQLSSITFLADGQRGWAVGDGGTILATRDAGATWQAQTSRARIGLYSSTFLGDSQNGWTVGSKGTILATRDAGATWQAQTSNSKEALTSVTFLPDGQRGWAVGYDGTILATRDAGATWQAQTSKSKEALTSATFLADGQRGWAVGAGGTILATRDAGATWQKQASESLSMLFSITFLADGQRGWAVGQDGQILVTKNAGATWDTQASRTLEVLSSVTFVADGKRGWVVGTSGTILATRDAGVTWQAQTSNSKEALTSVTFLPDGQRGWTVGSKGTILATRDAGATWQAQKSNTAANLESVTFLPDGQRGWAVGEGGTVLATRDGGSTWVSVANYARGHAPWFYAAVGVALVVPFVLLLVIRAKQIKQVLRDRILAAPVADEPLSDETRDRLGFAPVVRAMAGFMRHTATHPPVAFAVTAKWGRGKSSFMRMLQQRLKREHVPTVWFNAWHHQQEPVMLAPLLETIVRQAVPAWLSWAGLEFRVRLLARRVSARPSIGLGPLVVALLAISAAVIIGLSAVTVAAYNFGVEESRRAADPVMSAITSALFGALDYAGADLGFGALLGGKWEEFAKSFLQALAKDAHYLLVVPLLIWLVVSTWLLLTYFIQPFPASPAALLSSMTNKFNIKQAEEQTGFRQRFRQHFADVCDALQPRTLTIFIDDLDRCGHDKSAEMLEAINYLCDSGKCFVVMGIAREIVEAQLGQAYKDIAKRLAEFDGKPKDEAEGAAVAKDYAKNYLKKLVQIEIKLPSLTNDNLKALLLDEPNAADTSQEAIGQALAILDVADKSARLQRVWTGALQLLGAAGLIATLALIAQEVWQASGERNKNQSEKREEKLQAAKEYRSNLDVLDQQIQALSRAVEMLAKPSTPGKASAGDPVQAKVRLEHAKDARKDADEALKQYEKLTQAYSWRAAEGVERDQLLPSISRLQEKLGPAQIEGKGGAKSSGAATLTQPSLGLKGEKTKSSPIEPKAEAAQFPWEPAIPILLIAVLAAFGIRSSRRDPRIESSQTYKDAVKRWQPVLGINEQTNSPREAKRFLNLSRYLTLRLNAGEYTRWSWLEHWMLRRKDIPVAMDKAMDESLIVALTALYLTRPKEIQLQKFFEDPIGTAGERMAYERDKGNGGEVERAYCEVVEHAIETEPDEDSWPGSSPHPQMCEQFLKAVGEMA
jgi:photosystem II stability/assembly factor-like uncharacterized protein